MQPNGTLTDFTLEIPEKREIRILQITDMQPVDPGQKRYPERIKNSEPLTEEKLYDAIYRFIEDGVKRFSPDLIIATGDLVYGEFDDSGRMLQSLIRYMESLHLPWEPVFGNHDNESKKGVSWQCRQLEDAPQCLFRRGDLTGNGNYTVGITRGGELLRVLYMLDSNGCRGAYRYSFFPGYPHFNEGEKVRTDKGFGDDQVDWIRESGAAINRGAGKIVPKFFCFHFAEEMIDQAAQKKGYQTSAEKNRELYDLDRDNIALDGDFGKKGQDFSSFSSPAFREALQKAGGADGIFIGHDHVNSVSILCENGIRMTYGLKTGIHDFHDVLGTTAITVSEDGRRFRVEHLYCE